VSAVDAVLLIAFGGPERMEDVRPFLDNVLRGRPVPPDRYEAVVHHYELIGGGSPLNALTFQQADALRAELATAGPRLPVYVGMRCWSPYLADTLARMRADGVRRALGIVLAAHRSEASWQRYTVAVDAARATLGEGAPSVEYVAPWFDHPLFVEAVASRVEDALAMFSDAGGGEGIGLLFTAHSIPLAMASESPYVEQLEASCRLVAERLGYADWTLAYQSRSGSPRDPWLEPDVNDAIRALAGRGVRRVVLVPIGFACDHVEVLYDLDIEAAATARAAGVEMARAGTVKDHPAFIRMLAAVVRARVGGN